MIQGEEGKAAQVFTKLHMANMMKHLATTPTASQNFSRMIGLADSEDLFEATCSQLTDSLQSTQFSRAETKLRSNKTRHKKKFRNLEGILAIQGELITEAANYDPLGEATLCTGAGVYLNGISCCRVSLVPVLVSLQAG